MLCTIFIRILTHKPIHMNIELSVNEVHALFATYLANSVYIITVHIVIYSSFAYNLFLLSFLNVLTLSLSKPYLASMF